MDAFLNSGNLRVFLADDHPLVRRGLQALRHEDAGDAAPPGPSALDRVRALQPDFAILDLSLPEPQGLEDARTLYAACPQCRVLVLGRRGDDALVQHFRDAGVVAYELKPLAGAATRDQESIGTGTGDRRRPEPGPTVAADDATRGETADLSAREIEVLRLTAIGHGNKTIAGTLGIGLKSVETYKARGMSKLGIESRVKLMRFAMRHNWLDGL